MTTTADLEAALRAVAPADLHAHVPDLARLLGDVADNTLSSEAAKSQINADPGLVALVQALRALEVGGTTIQVGGATHIVGDVSSVQQVTITGGTLAGSVIGVLNTRYETLTAFQRRLLLVVGVATVGLAFFACIGSWTSVLLLAGLILLLLYWIARNPVQNPILTLEKSIIWP